jgi:thioredoxin 1
MVIVLTESNFDEIVTSENLVMVDFWAPWCAPCRAIAPVIDELSAEYAGKLTVAKCDIDSNGDIALRFGIRSIPTLLFFKHGKVVDKLLGGNSKTAIVAKLNTIL